MFNPVKFCFKHDRIKANTGDYLQLEKDSFVKLARARIHVQHQSCDRCPPEEKKVEAQGTLFEEE